MSLIVHYEESGIRGLTFNWREDNSGGNVLSIDFGITPSIVPTLLSETILVGDNQVFYGFKGSQNTLSITSLSLLVHDPACSDVILPVQEPIVPVEQASNISVAEEIVEEETEENTAE